ncbi:uncharacterized protein [Nicotiana tomentosiformis]|uniref:uncharacterized protein n=1 Tax=Nicotiana tomentosiformis TaxID=4098 RepID=UPI00388CA59B
MLVYTTPAQTEGISEKDSGRVPESLQIEDVSNRSQQIGNIYEGDVPESLQTEGNAPTYREACSRSRAELHRYEVDLKRVTEERNVLKLLLGQKREEIKDLRAELTKAHQDQTDLSEQKLELIEKLREEVDEIKAESVKWKENMNRLAVERETARAQLSSTKSQLQSLKEKSLAQAREKEKIEARLASELAEAEKIKVDADAMVAVYRDDVEAAVPC